MSNLIENILSNNLVEANKLLEERLAEIQERKLYEAKRIMAAQMNETSLGGRTISKAEKEMKARGLTPRRASEVLPDPREIKPKIEPKKTEPKKKSLSKMIRDKFARKPKTTTEPEKEYKPGIIGRNVNTLMGRQPDEKPQPSKGGRIGKAVRGTTKFGLRMLGDVLSGLEESTPMRPKRTIITRKKKSGTILVTKKTDPHAKTGGGVMRINKDKYNPKIHNLAVEE